MFSLSYTPFLKTFTVPVTFFIFVFVRLHKMADKNEVNEFRSEDLEDLISAESLDPLGELQSEKTLPKPLASKESNSKRKATLPNFYATSKPCAQ